MIASSRGARPKLALLVLVVLFVLVSIAPPAAATPVTCQRTIARAGAQFVKANAKALSKCKEALFKGKIPGPCPDTKAATTIAKAATKLAAAIDKSCGGVDQFCGGDLTLEDTPAALGWPPLCPNFEHGACTNPINGCGDIAPCVACIATAAVEQAIGLGYDDLVLAEPGRRSDQVPAGDRQGGGGVLGSRCESAAAMLGCALERQACRELRAPGGR